MDGDGISTAEAFAVLTEEDLEALWIEDAFGTDVLDVLAEDWCRMQHTVDEMAERQYLAGVYIAPVVSLPVLVNQPQTMRSAA